MGFGLLFLITMVLSLWGVDAMFSLVGISTDTAIMALPVDFMLAFILGLVTGLGVLLWLDG